MGSASCISPPQRCWASKRQSPRIIPIPDIVDAIRVHGADTRADIEELWRRIAFSILITSVIAYFRIGPLRRADVAWP